MDIVYVAHCVPWPPDKGERIRAFHSVRCLAEHYRVHLACVARNENETRASDELSTRLASVHIEVLDLPRAIVRGFLGAGLGGSFTPAFYHIPALHAYVRSVIADQPIGAVVLLSSSMALYAPERIPFIADWGDVDSEKRLQYARMRFPGLPHRLEAYRLRSIEREYAIRSRRTFFTTANELRLFQGIAPDAALGVAGNGVDTEWFDPAQRLPDVAELRDRKYIVFVGVLSYFPNSDGVCWFTRNIFPELRKRDPGEPVPGGAQSDAGGAGACEAGWRYGHGRG